MNELKITSNKGRVYNGIRAYHIALGHTVRNALLKFYDEVKQYAISEVQKFYDAEFHGSEYYDNTYGMIEALMESDDINGAISYYIKGNWEGNTTFNIDIDWEYLDAHNNGYGQWGTYTSLSEDNITNQWEEMMEQGLPKGILEKAGERHPSFNLGERINSYIEKNLENIITNAINNF